MNIIELLLIAVGVSMDAFAVSLCKGLSMKRYSIKAALALALSFGFFQALMPTLGYFLGSSLMWLIEPIDHWIAFMLLAIIGGKMLVEGIQSDNTCPVDDKPILTISELLVLSIATSIDAFAVGVTFAALGSHLWLSVGLIGITTFAFSLAGTVLGHFFHLCEERLANIIGGSVLVLIGVKILLSHLGIIAF